MGKHVALVDQFNEDEYPDVDNVDIDQSVH